MQNYIKDKGRNIVNRFDASENTEQPALLTNVMNPRIS
jgi:hypothetical protein